MCGISGVYCHGERSATVSENELLATREAMRARGPDGEGLWVSTDRRVGLAHRRLAIIDLSPGGAQPMSTVDGETVITFNGEIYNYRELRHGLEMRGVAFRTRSDTEVLLHLYRERGADMVDVLRGMFAFAIWDGRRKSLFLARDQFGIKPLYYADDGHTFRFASSVKALLAGGGVDNHVSAPGLVGYYLWGSVPDPYTLYRGIRALQSGTTLLVEHGRAPTTKRYFSVSHELGQCAEPPPFSHEGMREALALALKESVRHHLVSDVPVGLFLSAGLDSATIAGLAQEISRKPLNSLTLRFREYAGTANDEAPLAQMIARYYGTAHRTCDVEPEDMKLEMPRLLESMDQPSIDGVNTYFVSRAAAQAGMKVALSGTGGDEIFGGYPSFTQIPRAAQRMSRVPLSVPIGKVFRLVTAPWIRHFTSPKYAGLLEYGGSYGGLYLLRRGLYMPWELPRVMDPDLARQGWRELQPVARLDRKIARIDSSHARVAAMELRMYLRNQLLRDADWAGMAWSVEIRVPLVDRDLFRFVAPLMGLAHPPDKLDMADAPSKKLPAQVLTRPKTGFSVPVATWMPGEHGERGLRGWARKLVDDAPSRPAYS